jgi:hypothetical protein
MRDDAGEDAAQILRQAFAAAPRPREDEIAPHDCYECRDVRNALAPYEFDSVPDEVLDSVGSAIPLLGGAALRYYLPAYLLRSMRKPPYVRLDAVVDYLATADTDERYLEFSSAERAAVCSFIEWFAGTGEAASWSEELARAKIAWPDCAG